MVVRIISGIVGIAIAAVIIQIGNLPFVAFTVLLSLIGWYEYAKMMKAKGIDITFVLGALTLIVMLCCAWLGSIEELMAVLTIGMLLIFLMTVILHGSVRPIDACASIAGVLYIGLPFSHLILLRFLDEERLDTKVNSISALSNLGDLSVVENAVTSLTTFNLDIGSALIWLLFICTWSSDTFAYFVGTAIGSHKLASSISPNKTVEGFLGGVLGTTAMAVVVGHILFDFPLIEMAILGSIMAIVATFGDLVESVMKRFANVKDSGILLPGHGGMLDRFDSIFYTAPFFYYFVIIAGLV